MSPHLSLLLLLACGGASDAPEPAAEPAAAEAPPAAEPPPEESTAMYGLHGVDWACAPCVGLDLANLDEVKVSSWLDKDARYGGSKALDGKLETAWCEGADGPGVGETLRIRLRKPMLLNAVGVRGGYFKSEELLAANGRVKSVRITSSAGHDEVMNLADPTVALDVDPSIGPDQPAGRIAPGEWYQRAATGEIPRVGVTELEQPIEWVQLELLEVWPGSKYTDTCISELELLLVDPAEL